MPRPSLAHALLRRLSLRGLGIGLALAIAVAITTFALLFDLTAGVNARFVETRDAMMQRPASDQIVIVEIDAKSLAQMGSWPWPRDYYAGLVERLDAAGVSQIAFDIDFSAPSTAAGDARFAAALAGAQASVILPTFRQRESQNADAFLESLPIPALADHAFLASVNVHPGREGQVNHYSYGTMTAGTARPSLASMVAARQARIEESFAIDQRIDPASIARMSFIDVLGSKQALPNLRGKAVIIGATAIEMGDRYAMRSHGVQPGVVVQAMATATLLAGTDLPDWGSVPALLLALLAAVLMARTWRSGGKGIAQILLATGIVMVAAAWTLHAADIAYITIVPALLFVTSFAVALKLIAMAQTIRHSRFVNDSSGLPSRAAMLRDAGGKTEPIFAAGMIANMDEVSALLGDAERQRLWQLLAKRLALFAGDSGLYHLDRSSFGWLVRDDYRDSHDDLFAAAAAFFRSPFLIDDRKITLKVHFGVDTQALDLAETAAQQAHSNGARWALIDSSKRAAISNRQIILSDVGEALENQQFWVAYQPKMALSGDRIIGAEALVRWDHPQLGKIGPDMFIPMLEAEERMAELTLFVLRRCLLDCKQWQADGLTLHLAINISAGLLGDSQFIDTAIAQVEASRVPPQQLTFEVTESAALSDPEMARIALHRLVYAGLTISIDDYGTGQSTLSYLQQFPAKEVKIDQCFVRTMRENPADRILVRSSIELAHALGFTVVAEGVEDRDSLELLRQFDCDVVQGWLIGRPMAAADFIACVRGWRGFDDEVPQHQAVAA